MPRHGPREINSPLSQALYRLSAEMRSVASSPASAAVKVFRKRQWARSAGSVRSGDQIQWPATVTGDCVVSM